MICMQRYEIKPKSEVIDQQIDAASAWENKGTTAVRGMTYEQGVLMALRWVIGDDDALPIEGEPEE